MLSLALLPLTILVLLAASHIEASGFGSCSTVPQDVLERETITMDRKSHLVQQRGNTDWRTPGGGFIVKAVGHNEIVVAASGSSSEIWNHNFVKIHSNKEMGNTQWLWLDKGGACTVGIDYLDIAAGTLYRQK